MFVLRPDGAANRGQRPPDFVIRRCCSIAPVNGTRKTVRPSTRRGARGPAKRRHPGASGGGPSGKAVREYFAWCNLGGRALRGGLIPRHLFLGFLKQRMGKGEVGLRYIIVNMRFIPLSIPDGEGREPKGRKGRGFGRRAAGRKGEARFETFNPHFDHL